MDFNIETLVDVVATKTGYKKKEVNKIIRELVHLIPDLLISGHTVKLRGVGTLQRYASKKLKTYSPYTGKIVYTPPKYRIRFKASKRLRGFDLDTK